MKYNHLFETQFRGCLHLAGYQDPHRNRSVRIYMIPGDHSNVGIWDGVDAWVAPVNTTVAGVNLVAVLESVRNGTFQGPSAVRTHRKMIHVESAAKPEIKTVRRRINV